MTDRPRAIDAPAVRASRRPEGAAVSPGRSGTMLAVLYTLFFFSGAAALTYEIVWVRSLSLVFGGAHLAVTTVLSVFMGGLALGGRLFGRIADRAGRWLALYGLIEIGIALFALVSLGLIRAFPVLYGPMARGAESSPVYLSAVRVLLCAVALIIPTTLMGGTLPVLSRFAASKPEGVGRHLALLYGFNTLGAVTGTLASAFVLLRSFGVQRTLGIAIGVNAAVGLGALLCQRWIEDVPAAGTARGGGAEAHARGGGGTWDTEKAGTFVLGGIAISGFCALGYEVLWTRMLTMVVGTSVYSFAIMLTAFLAGIALGSEAHALVSVRLPGLGASRGRVLVFGGVQAVIGVSALAVTWALRDLPGQAIRLQSLIQSSGASEFQLRQGTSFLLAFTYMAVPAFFMGFAFPLAGEILAGSRGRLGEAVGKIMAFNTVGAILGAATAGFGLVYLFGIERALQLLAVVNLGSALFAAGLASQRRGARTAAVAMSAAAALVLVAFPEWGRAWDRKYFAVFRNNQRSAFDTPERLRDALENTDVLYYHEGINETISVIRPRGAEQGLLVNGRVEASTHRMDRQCQRTLGHLPMLLHRRPREVFCLGLGTGMTLGATSLHPEVERLTLAEIEPGVLPAARTFAAFNQQVLDNPKLRIVFNDGRNYLSITDETFDVITADPIHPWSGGAAYLYTAEYFRIASSRLKPGGIMCQWLPIYELTPKDLRTVVRTFGENFRYTVVWLTHYDAEIAGSNDPIVIDPRELARRVAHPAIAADLADVEMGSAEDFLSYFVMGSEGARRFGSGGVLNTDDNLHLEFSSVESMGLSRVMGENVAALGSSREPLSRYLTASGAGVAEPRNLEAARLYDRAHALFLWGKRGSPEFLAAAEELRRLHPRYAPWRFLEGELAEEIGRTPRLVEAARFDFEDARGALRTLEVSAVTMRVGESRAAVVVVDNAAREIFGQAYIDRPAAELEAATTALAAGILHALRETYRTELAAARASGREAPLEAPFRNRVRSVTSQAIQELGAAAGR